MHSYSIHNRTSTINTLTILHVGDRHLPFFGLSCSSPSGKVNVYHFSKLIARYPKSPVGSQTSRVVRKDHQILLDVLSEIQKAHRVLQKLKSVIPREK